MTGRDKMIFIKYSINRIINKMYNEYENGIISRVINTDDNSEITKWFGELSNVRIGGKDGPFHVILYYDDMNTIDMTAFDNTKHEYAQGIISSLVGKDPMASGGTIFIDDLYNKLIELDNYSDEELKLYFKLSS